MPRLVCLEATDPSTVLKALFTEPFVLLLKPGLPFALKQAIVHTLAQVRHPLKGVGILTSGTSGTPKIAVATLENHIASAKASQAMIPISASDRWRLNLPLYHVGGLAILFRCLLFGATWVTGEEEATHLSCVPTQLFRMIKANTHNKYKAVLVGGAPLPDSLLETALQHYPVIPTYGLTEMCSQVATGIPTRLLPGVDAKIIDGEICVQGPSLFQGYLHNGHLVLPLKEGYFPTGDLGTLDQGTLTVVGRRDRMFLSGGEKIHPEEIERALLNVEGILSAHVQGAKCPEWGTRAVAFLTVRQEIPIPLIKEKLLEHLDRWKIPSEFFQKVH